jgi:branched-chain amino acid aminotransferase
MVSIWHCDLSVEPAETIRYVLHPAPSSLDEASRRLPAGAYTTMRTYAQQKVLRLREHFTRLCESAKLTGYDVVLNEQGIRQGIRQILEREYPGQEMRLRLTLDLSHEPGVVFLSFENLHIPSLLDYELGVCVVTCDLHRVQPQAKLTDFIAPASNYRLSLPQNVNEALMVDSQGDILEGLSSNFFAIRDGKLITVEEGVLAGITRGLVIDAAGLLDFPVEYRAVNIAEISATDEAFITSASRGILPVKQVDNQLIGDGHPGEMTRRLSTAFDQLVARELEII